MYLTHQLDVENLFEIKIDGTVLERVSEWKVLGIHFDEHLKWNHQINKLLKSCYSKLFVLRKLKRFSSFNNRKHLAESLILSKLDYCNVLYSNVTQQSINRMQKLLNSVASFVTGKYCKIEDVINLGWLPIRERIEFSTLKLAHKSIYDDNFPDYLSLEFMKSSRTLRSNNDVFNLVRDVDGTFRGTASKLYNILPYNIKSLSNSKTYSMKLKQYLLGKSLATHLSKY